MTVLAGIAVDGSGNAYVTGYTAIRQLPHHRRCLPDAFGGGGYDAFVTKLNAAGTALVYSTYLGGNRTTMWAMASRWTAPATPTSRASPASTNFPTTARRLPDHLMAAATMPS